MTLNFPGPYTLAMSYVESGLTHVQSLNIALSADPEPGTPFDEISAVKKGGGNYALDDWCDDYCDIIDGAFADTTEVVVFDLYKNAPLSFDRQWISGLSLSATGTSEEAATLASEYIFTFRTYEGGLMQLRYEEVPISNFLRRAAGSVTPGHWDAQLLDFVLGDNGIILGRDTSYPIAALYILPGQNEKIFKKRYR